MKKIGLFPVMLLLLLTLPRQSNAKVHFNIQFQNPCCEGPIRPPYLFTNISDFECMVKCAFPDSSELIKIVDEIRNFLNDQGFDADKINSRSIWTIYSFDRHRDILFFEIKHPRAPGLIFNVAFNNKKGEFFSIREIEDIEGFLSTEDFGLVSDGNILRYCWIVTMLRDQEVPIKIISSLGELLVYALLNYRPPIDFDTVEKYYDENIKIEMPKIEKNWIQKDSEPYLPHKMVPGIDTAKVSFFMARARKILKVKIELSGQNIISYNEESLGETIDWCGSGLHEWHFNGGE